MELKEYISHMHCLITDFENYWKEHESDENFPQNLPIESWDEQLDFFAEHPNE
jgi:plasmid rolling circle replication initiator protein Rep